MEVVVVAVVVMVMVAWCCGVALRWKISWKS